MKTLKTSVIAISLTLSMSFANSLPKSCIEEFVKLPATKADFNIEAFLKELPAEVVKVKAQLKLPFGKPADSKKTDIGITVGCLKLFPESANAIAPFLKALSIEMAKNIASGKPGTTVQSTSNTRQGGSNENQVVEKNVIYLQNGQEIRDAVVTRIGVDEVEYKVGTRVAVYATRRSDISAILHSDGVKEFFCNGTLYNSVTHYCYSDGQTYSCGNKPYNPATQFCFYDKVHRKCGDKLHNPATHYCHTDDKIYSCDDKPYNPVMQFCYNNNQILNKCGGNNYDPTTHFCHIDGRTYSCEGNPYNPTTHFCPGEIYLCDGKPYKPLTHLCHTDGKAYSCGGKPYNPTTHFCHIDGRTYSCGNKPYNPATHFCNARLQNILVRP